MALKIPDEVVATIVTTAARCPAGALLDDILAGFRTAPPAAQVLRWLLQLASARLIEIDTTTTPYRYFATAKAHAFLQSPTDPAGATAAPNPVVKMPSASAHTSSGASVKPVASVPDTSVGASAKSAAKMADASVVPSPPSVAKRPGASVVSSAGASTVTDVKPGFASAVASANRGAIALDALAHADGTASEKSVAKTPDASAPAFGGASADPDAKSDSASASVSVAMGSTMPAASSHGAAATSAQPLAKAPITSAPTSVDASVVQATKPAIASAGASVAASANAGQRTPDTSAHASGSTSEEWVAKTPDASAPASGGVSADQDTKSGSASASASVATSAPPVAKPPATFADASVQASAQPVAKLPPASVPSSGYASAPLSVDPSASASAELVGKTPGASVLSSGPASAAPSVAASVAKSVSASVQASATKRLAAGVPAGSSSVGRRGRPLYVVVVVLLVAAGAGLVARWPGPVAALSRGRSIGSKPVSGAGSGSAEPGIPPVEVPALGVRIQRAAPSLAGLNGADSDRGSGSATDGTQPVSTPVGGMANIPGQPVDPPEHRPPPGLPPDAVAPVTGSSNISVAGSAGVGQFTAEPPAKPAQPPSAPARPLPAWPVKSGAYVLSHGRWAALPKNNGHVVQSASDAFTAKLIDEQLESDPGTANTPVGKLVIGQLVFDGTDEVPVASSADFVIVYVGQLAKSSGPAIEMTSLNGSVGTRQTRLFPVAARRPGFGGDRVPATLETPRTDVTVLRPARPLPGAEYAVLCGTEAYEVQVK